MAEKIPVTVLTGFLGSGKTTLLNRILTENHGQRIAVIENEYGEIGVDQEMVINADEEIFEMNNGCICCTVRGDLIRILGNLMKRRDKFDRILIETTGLADPGPVAQTFFVDDDMRDEMSLDGIITLVDALHAHLHLEDSPEARAQIAFADVILLNKVDLVSEAELALLERRLRSMNGVARFKRVHMADAPMDQVLNIGGFDLDRALQTRPEFLAPEYPFEWRADFDLRHGQYTLTLREGPDPTMYVAWLPDSGESGQDITESAVRLFARAAKKTAPGGILEAGVHHQLMLDGPGEKAFRFPANMPGRYVLFTQHLPEEFDLDLVDVSGGSLEPVAEVRFAASHTHEDSIGSVGIEFDGAVDGERVNAWLSFLLQSKGADIFRMKGFLNVEGEQERFVFQGVHMLFEGRPSGPWGRSRRSNRLVFIGRDLDRAELETGFKACLVR
jgi:G3E family GTPase